MTTPNPIVTININITTPDLNDPQLDRLKAYFAGMETVLKLIIAIQTNSVPPLGGDQIHNNGHEKEVTRIGQTT